jgi:TusA-related sulfurtransferase
MKVADHNITNVLSILINSEKFCNIVTSFCELEMHMVAPLTSLVQTVEYLIRKY